MTEDEIIRRYGDDVRAFARSLDFYLPGSERQDVEQEALIGLLRAVRTYRPELGVPFWPGFAKMCVRRWLVWTLRRDNRQQAKPLTNAERIARNEYDEVVAISEMVPDPRAGVPELLIAREELRRLVECGWHELTELERRSVFGLALGYSYVEIEGCESGRRVRQVDNAIQRGREKLRQAA